MACGTCGMGVARSRRLAVCLCECILLDNGEHKSARAALMPAGCTRLQPGAHASFWRGAHASSRRHTLPPGAHGAILFYAAYPERVQRATLPLQPSWAVRECRACAMCPAGLARDAWRTQFHAGRVVRTVRCAARRRVDMEHRRGRQAAAGCLLLRHDVMRCQLGVSCDPLRASAQPNAARSGVWALGVAGMGAGRSSSGAT